MKTYISNFLKSNCECWIVKTTRFCGHVESCLLWTYYTLILSSRSLRDGGRRWPDAGFQNYLRTYVSYKIAQFCKSHLGFLWLALFFEYVVYYTLGVKIRNLKVNFKTGGTWRRVGQWSLIMNICDFFLFDLVV